MAELLGEAARSFPRAVARGSRAARSTTSAASPGRAKVIDLERIGRRLPGKRKAPRAQGRAGRLFLEQHLFQPQLRNAMKLIFFRPSFVQSISGTRSSALRPHDVIRAIIRRAVMRQGDPLKAV
jgi:hypothetical protein